MTGQPIIRGIQTVGHVDVTYRYNKYSDAKKKYILPIPKGFKFGDVDPESGDYAIDLGTAGKLVAGFRLDAEFLRANPQIASSFTIPLLGGGGVSLTNNNRTGSLTLVCTKVSVPTLGEVSSGNTVNMKAATGDGASVGVDSTTQFYDLVTLAQIQQGQVGGDGYGANITFEFEFSGIVNTIEFQACTVATVDPLGLAGNNAVDYQIVFNYLNWTASSKKLDTSAENFTLVDTKAQS